MATVSDSDDKIVTGVSWEIGVSFTGEGGTAVDGLWRFVVGEKGSDITAKGARDAGEWVDRAVSTICAPRDDPGICSTGSWRSIVAPNEAPFGVAWRGLVGVEVGLVGEDRTCARVRTKESCGRYTTHPIVLRLGTRALGADKYADIGRIQRITD